MNAVSEFHSIACHHLVLVVDISSGLQQSLNSLSVSLLSSYPQRNRTMLCICIYKCVSKFTSAYIYRRQSRKQGHRQDLDVEFLQQRYQVA